MNGLWAARFFGALSLAALAAVPLAGCGGGEQSQSNGGNGGTMGTGGMSGGAGGSGASGGAGGGGQSNHGDAYATAVCGNVFKCCNAPDLVALFNSGGLGNQAVVDYAGCRILYRSVWDGALEPAVTQGVAAGRLDFDEGAFETCMKTVAEQACNQPKSDAPLCPDIFIPKVQMGGTCALSIECTTGLCTIPSGQAEGTCVQKPTPAALGEKCGNTDDCGEKLYCDNQKCAQVLADGEACTNKDQCQSGTCVDKAPGMGQCATICQGGGPGPGATNPALEPLGAVLAKAECGKIFNCCSPMELGSVTPLGVVAELQCLQLLSVFSGIALVQVHNSAAESKLSVDGAKLSACLDQYAALSCQEFAKGDTFQCPDGIKGLVADGAACTSDNQCTSKYCNQPMPGQGTCAALPAVGAPCTSDCAEGFYCDAQKKCVAQKVVGEVCTSSSQCSEGRCYGSAGNPKTCALICDGN